MLFDALSPTPEQALADATLFDSIEAMEAAGLLAGLEGTERATVLNCRFGPSWTR